MPIQINVDNESLRKCEDTYDVVMNLTPIQAEDLGQKGQTVLSIDQIVSFVDTFFFETEELTDFVLSQSEKFQPMSLTLFVINPDTWKLMLRKPDYQDRMLPMVSIPWFFTRSTLKSKKNPLGIKRAKNKGITIKLERTQFIFEGEGGDYYGVLEERIAEDTQRIRPLIIPGSFGGTNLVPAYKRKMIRVKVEQGHAHVTICPSPRKELDYRFSDHPKTFYENGLEIRSVDQSIRLSVGFSRDTLLAGEVILLVGRAFDANTPIYHKLEYYIWLCALAKALSSSSEVS